MLGTLGGPELILILVIALIVFGPRKLPDIGRSVGRMMAEFRRASNDFRRTLEDEVETEKTRASSSAQLGPAVPPPATLPLPTGDGHPAAPDASPPPPPPAAAGPGPQ